MTDNRLDELLGLSRGSVGSALSLGQSCRYTQHVIARGRIVWEPRHELKLVQRSVRLLIQSHFEPHRIAHAYTSGRSIITNAEQHIRKKLLLHLDLENFFPSISADTVARKLQRLLPHPDLADIEKLVDLCCLDGRLPQGAPTSPILSNLVCYDLDGELYSLGQSLKFDPSRYSDDFALSTNEEEFSEAIVKINDGVIPRYEVGTALVQLIEGHGFSINPRKLRLQTRFARQQVTGLLVNDGVSVPIEYRRGIRATLHRWKILDVRAGANLFRQGMTTDKYVETVNGRIGFVRQVGGKNCPHYQRLSHELGELVARDAPYLSAATISKFSSARS